MAEDEGSKKGKGGGGRREDSPAELIISDIIGMFTRITGRNIASHLPADIKQQARGIGLSQALRGLATFGKYVVPGDEEARNSFEGFFRGLADGFRDVPDADLRGKYATLITDNPHLAKLEALAKEGRLDENRFTVSYPEAFAQLEPERKLVMMELVRYFKDNGAYMKARLTLLALNGVASMAEHEKRENRLASFAPTAMTILMPPVSAPEKALSNMQRTIEGVKKLFGASTPGHLTVAQQTAKMKKKARANVTPHHLITGAPAPKSKKSP